MNNNEIQELIEIRNLLITKYKRLDGRSNPSTAVVLQKDVAGLIESTISRIDRLLANYVSIKSDS